MAECEKPIQKKVLHAGNKGLREFPCGSKIFFHFVTKLGREPDGDVLDDSRTWAKPMELIMGKKFKLEVWETCIETMCVGEVASFVVKPALVLNYPTVAKTLRDTFGHKGRMKAKEERPQHMCSMMAMQAEGGLGYEDLNVLLKEPQDLTFIIEVLRVQLPHEYQKESWQLDPEEKLQSIAQLKEEGNQLFRQGEVQAACAKYGDALGRLEQLMLREKPHDKDWNDLQEKKVPLLLNYSQCLLSLQRYYEVIEHCSNVLSIEPTNVKALFRRGKANAGAWNVAEAIEDFSRVSELDCGLSATCAKLIRDMEEQRRLKDCADKDRMKHLFQ